MLRYFHSVLFLLAAVCLSLSCSSLSKQNNVPVVQADNAVFGNSLIHYVTAGQGGTPLVLVHGWGGDHHFWQGQIGPLAQERTVVAVDLLGHGLSGKPKVLYTQRSFADSLIVVMDQAGIDRAVLVGHSMGGSVIRQAALRYPERVAGLILVDGALFDPPEDYGALLTWQLQMEGFVNNFRTPSADVFTWEFLESLHTEETPEEVKKIIRDTVLATPNHVRVSAMEEFVNPEVWRGGPVHAPTLAVYAVSPDLPPDFESYLQREFPNHAYHLWDGPGHFIMMERPDELNRLMLEWLEHQAL